MTPKQEKFLIEKYIRPMVRRMLKESEVKSEFDTNHPDVEKDLYTRINKIYDTYHDEVSDMYSWLRALERLKMKIQQDIKKYEGK